MSQDYLMVYHDWNDEMFLCGKIKAASRAKAEDIALEYIMKTAKKDASDAPIFYIIPYFAVEYIN